MDARHCWPPLAFVCLLLLTAVAGSGVAAPAPAFAQETPTPPAVDNTVTRVELAADGSARWTVTIRTRLDSQSDLEEYEAFQARFRANTSRFLDPFESRITAVVTNAGDATGRTMTATDFGAETRIQEVPRRWGIVEYAFTWSGFAAVEGDAVVVGDAFAGGFFLAVNDTLVVVAPPGYSVAAVEPPPTQRGERSVGWTGRRDFPDGRPLVRAEPAPGGGNDPAGDGGIPVLPLSTPVAAGAVGLAAILALAAFAYRRRLGGAPPAGPSVGSGQTDEERVLELLEARGGRVPQATIVEAFDWSTSKTSRLLSRMADEGAVEKHQLGRENHIRLPDEED